MSLELYDEFLCLLCLFFFFFLSRLRLLSLELSDTELEVFELDEELEELEDSSYLFCADILFFTSKGLGVVGLFGFTIAWVGVFNFVCSACIGIF